MTPSLGWHTLKRVLQHIVAPSRTNAAATAGSLEPCPEEPGQPARMEMPHCLAAHPRDASLSQGRPVI